MTGAVEDGDAKVDIPRDDDGRRLGTSHCPTNGDTTLGSNSNRMSHMLIRYRMTTAGGI